MAPLRDFYPASPRHCHSEIMELSRLTQAAAALSAVLCSRGIGHAFYGSIFPALLAKIPVTDVSPFPTRRVISFCFSLSYSGDFLHR